MCTLSLNISLNFCVQTNSMILLIFFFLKDKKKKRNLIVRLTAVIEIGDNRALSLRLRLPLSLTLAKCILHRL